MQRLERHEELFDGPLPDASVLAASLTDLERVNRWLGGVALSRRALIRLLRWARTTGAVDRLGRTGPVRVLDVGTGGADIPRALVQWAGARGLRLEFEATDNREEMLAIARQRAGDMSGVTLALADGLSLPYRDGEFDVAHTSLMAHHLEPEALRACLRELGRVARLGVIVNDLARGWLGFAGALLLARLFTRNPLTRHDGPVSVRRAYLPAEVTRLAEREGLAEVARVTGFLGHRYALVFARRDEPRTGGGRIARHGPDGVSAA